MADRSVTVRLKAETSAFTTRMVAAGRTAKTALDGTLTSAQKNKAALREVGNAAGLMGAAAAVGVGYAIKAAADFDQAMSNVQAATHASGRTMQQFRDLALDMGAKTAFSATEAADGIEQLSKAGVSAKDIMGGGLKGALNLAAAGQISVGEAAEDTATALTQFQLNGGQASHVADLLAAGAGKAQGEVSDMANALKYAGVPASNLGVSIEETAGTIALFAKNGIIGEQAGTSMRGMLSSLTSPSAAAAKQMDELGINVFDAQGKFLGFDGVAGQLHDRLGNLTQQERANALGRIFGNEQLQAANVLYREGAKGVDTWTHKVNDAGYAAQTAATKQDNLRGDLEKLKGSLDTFLIGAGEGAQSPLRGLIQNLTGVLDAMNKLPGPVKSAGLEFLALIAVTGGATFLGARFITTVAEARAAVQELGISAGITRGALASMGKGIVLTGFLIGANLIDDKLRDIFHTDIDPSAINKAMSSLGENGKASGELLSTFGKGLEGFGTQIKVMDTDKLHGLFDWVPGKAFNTPFEDAKANIDKIDKSLADLVHSGNTETAKAAFQQLAAAAAAQGISVKDILKYMPQYKDALADNADASHKSGGATKKHAGAVDEDTGAVKSETSALQANIRAHNARSKSLLDNIDKELNWKQAVIDGRKEARQGAKTLNTNTQAGIDNKRALASMASEWNNLTDKQKRAQGGTKAARAEFFRIARQMGDDQDEAHQLARELLNIPNPKRKVEVDTRTARNEVGGFVSWLNGELTRGIKDEDVKVKLSAQTQSVFDAISAVSSGGLSLLGGPHKATGGPIHGPGTGTSDDVLMWSNHNGPWWGSNGEHVVTSEEVLKAGRGSATRGHKIWEGIRHAALIGALPDPMDLPRYSTGGAIRPRVERGGGFDQVINSIDSVFGGIVDRVSAGLSERVNRAFQFAGGGAPLGPGGTLSAGQILRGQQFANAQNGKPYIWGGVGPAGYDCCLTGETLVAGPFGARRMDEIAPGDMVWSFVDGDLEAHPVLNAWFSKRQMTYRVRTRNRSVIASDNHPFLRLAMTKSSYPVIGGERGERIPAEYDVEWARVDELHEGDMLVQFNGADDNGAPAEFSDGTPITSDVAWLIGTAIGDGTVTHKSLRLCMFGEKRERAAQIMHALTGCTPTYTDQAGVIATNRWLADQLNALGMDKRGRDKRVPAEVWTWGADLQRAFLEGYCDADGHRPVDQTKHGERTYSSCSRDLVGEVRLLHIVLGDQVSNISTNYRLKPITINGVAVKNALSLHSFTVWTGVRNGQQGLARRPGVAAKLAEWGGHFTLAKVLNIDPVGERDTYDIEVKGSHNFIADGVTVHNSGYQSAIINASLGRNPYSRIGSTGSMPWPGFKSGTGLYTIGWFQGDPGHTSGNIGGLGVESTGDHVRNGSAARSPTSSLFTNVAHYDTGGIWPNNTLGVNTSGGDEIVLNPRRFADGGQITPAERKQRRQDRRDQRQEDRKQTREDRQEKRKEDRQQAREQAREDARDARQLQREQFFARKRGLRHFDITGKEDHGEVRSEIGELRATLRDAFGRDSGAVKAINRLDGRLLKVSEKHDKLIRTEEKLSEHLKGLRDAQRQYASEVSGAYRHDLFAGGLEDLNLQERADTNDARRTRHKLRIAQHRGLSGGLFRELAASGNTTLIGAFAHLSRRQISHQERLYAQRQQSTAALGQLAGHEVYGHAIHEDIRERRRNNRHLRDNTRTMRRLGRTMEHRVSRETGGARKKARSGA